MVRRLVIVLLLMVFPLQWSAAQGHELADDAGALAAVFSGRGDVSELLAHTDEPGGVCQFHELSQPSAMLETHPAAGATPWAGEEWMLARDLTLLGSRAPDEVEKPKWSGRLFPAANS